MKKLFIITLLFFGSITVSLGQVWQDYKASSFAGGNGSSENPYMISTPEQLAYFSRYVFDNLGCYGKYFVLTTDIDLSNRFFTPIGRSSYFGIVNFSPFKGHFDARGHTISNLKIDCCGHIGLFCGMSNGTIKNLTIKNPMLYSCNIREYAGVLVGLVNWAEKFFANYTIIENVQVIGGTVEQKNSYSAGGLIGKMSSLYITYFTIKNSAVVNTLIKVGLGGASTGGLVGLIDGKATLTMMDCASSVTVNKDNLSNDNSIHGGFVGVNHGVLNFERLVFSGGTNISNMFHFLNFLGVNKGSISVVQPVFVNSSNWLSHDSYLQDRGTSLSRNDFSVGSQMFKKTYGELTSREFAYELNTRFPESNNRLVWTKSNSTTEILYPQSNHAIVKISKSNADILRMNNMISGDKGSYSGNECFAIANNSNVNIYFTNKHDDNEMGEIDYVGVTAGLPSIEYFDAGMAYFQTPRADVRIDVRYKKIPYITNPSATFKTSNKSVQLLWTTNNTNGSIASGKIYIDRAMEGESYTNNIVELPLGTTSYVDTSSALRYQKTYQYRIRFTEDSYKNSSSHYPHHAGRVVIETLPSVDYTNLRISPSSTSIMLGWSIPEEIAAIGGLSYYVVRDGKKSNVISVIGNATDFSFTDSNTSEFGSIDVCNSYHYAVVYKFPNVFPWHGFEVRSSPFPPANLISNDYILKLTATKGEHPSFVKLYYEVHYKATAQRKLLERRVAETSHEWKEIYRVTNGDSDGYYTDNTTLPGICYEYRLRLQGICDSTTLDRHIFDNVIGFCQTTGTVAGRITYGNGTAVKNVAVMVQQADLENESSQFNGLQINSANHYGRWLYPSTAIAKDLFVGSPYSFQFFINPSAHNGFGRKQVLDISDVLTLYLVESSSRFKFTIVAKSQDNNSTTIDLPNHFSIPANKFTHISITREENTLSFYVVNDENRDSIFIEKHAAIVPHLGMSESFTTTSISGITFGNGFIGYIDELRLWTKTLTAEEIEFNHNKYLVGNEKYLKAYWKFDEGLSKHFFDCSQEKGVFNGHHGILEGALPTKHLPEIWQLGLIAKTDDQGNYLIRGIPFNGGDGSTYKVIPMLGIHQFDPAHDLRYIGTTSLTHNGIDFKDISAFPIRGKVVYDGGNYPVEGCNFYVDGQILVNKEGNPITSNFDGQFTFDVPIGQHIVQVRKDKHIFANGGYLKNSNGTNIIYNDKIEGVVFTDLTKVKLVGRIIGGLRESDKPLGFGESVNNIGGGNKIILTPEILSYNLTTHEQEMTFSHTDAGQRVQNLNDNKVNIKPKEIVIEASPISGEYIAWLPPINYHISGLWAFGENRLTSSQVLNMSGVFMNQYHIRTQQLRDSIVKDSTMYHYQFNYTYRSTPHLSIVENMTDNKPKQVGKINYFGEKEVIYTNPATQENITLPLIIFDTINHSKTYLLGKPVYIQGKKYNYTVNAFEAYTFDKVPVSKGSITIDNSMKLTTNNIETVSLDSLGSAVYHFVAGAPDLTTGVKKFEAVLNTGNSTYSWNDSFTSYGLGSRSTGSNFTTAGPNEIHFVLRDPPGSKSMTKLEKGSKVVYSKSSRFENNNIVGIGTELDLGPKITSFVGIGAGIIFEADIIADLDVNVTTKTAYSESNETVNSVTYNRIYTTSSDPLWVGSKADVFVGNATNIIYGACDAITIVPFHKKGSLDVIFFESEGANIAFGKARTLAIGQTFSTHFAYTQEFIEKNFVPTLHKLRNNLLITGNVPNANLINRPMYWSKLSEDDPKFGSSNIDVDVWGRDIVNNLANIYDGPSYKIIFPSSNPEIKEHFSLDSVHWYNQQIDQWHFILAENERMKLDAEKINNISFTSGAAYSQQELNTQNVRRTTKWDLIVNTHVANKFGGEISGIKTLVKTSFDLALGGGGTESTDTESKLDVGFTLQEDGANDNLTVDIKKAADGTFAFATLGGQTQCPYEGEELTKYHRQGTLLNTATMQIEVPKIAVVSSQAVNISANRPAVFELELKNESESATDIMYDFRVRNNPDGALFKMDGKSITGDGEKIGVLIKSGETVKKTVTIEKGPLVMEHKDIEFILASQCQWQPDKTLPLIEDMVKVSASFIPNCSDITIEAPLHQWTMNTITGDSIFVRLGNFDRNFANFGYIKLLYKGSASSLWTTAMTFYCDEQKYNDSEETNKILLTNAQPDIQYWLRLPNIDQHYDIMAISYCVNEQGKIIAQTPTKVVGGIRDMYRPRLFGNIEPADGILSTGDQIAIQFNEPIQAGSITNNNFTVQGIRNGAMVELGTSILFDGLTTVLKTEQNITLSNSFSMEAWVKLNNIQSGTVLSFGENCNIGFDNNGKLKVTMNGNTTTSVQTFKDVKEQIHIALSYNAENSRFEAIVNDNVVCSGAAQLMTTPQPLFVGANIDANYFSGWINNVRLWNRSLTLPEIYSNMHTNLTGNEYGLVGCWNMTEGKGNIILDKARYRHLIGKPTWAITPTGFAIDLQTNSSVKINTGSSVVIPFDKDFTIEFWFNGNTQQNACLFSCGHGMADNNTANKLSIFVDNTGKLILNAHNKQNIITDINYLDNQWHHFALSVNRTGTANVYIDTELKTTIPVNQISGLANGFMYLGKRVWHQVVEGEVVEKSEMDFIGKIDELRFWNVALTKDVLTMRHNTKLQGNESGLLAYYPFDKYIANDNNINELIFTTEDMSEKKLSDIVSYPNVNQTKHTPTIKNITTLDNLSYEYVINHDKIVINITEEPQRIANIQILIGVKDIEDINGNTMHGEYQWTAWIDNQAIVWKNKEESHTKPLHQSIVFTTPITNRTGKVQEFIIQDLPHWLTVAPTTGSIAPNSTISIQFTVDENTNAGNYFETIIVRNPENTTYDILSLNIKALAEKPLWDLDKTIYENSMNIVAIVKKQDAIIGSTEDLIGCFIENQCIGITTTTYLQQSNTYINFMVLYGNTNNYGKSISFKYWEAATGNIYVIQPSEDIVFRQDAIIGKPSNPVIFTLTNLLNQNIHLQKGWNWTAINLKPQNNSLNKIFRSLSGDDVNVIKSHTQFAQYNNGIYAGTLTTIDPVKMYMINSNTAQSFTIEGYTLKDTSKVIQLKTGWNWIGNTLLTNQPIRQALSGYEAINNEIIRSQDKFAIYDSILGWTGSLTTLTTGVGYKMKVENDKTIILNQTITPQTPTAQNPRTQPKNYTTNLHYNVNPHDYEHSVIVVGGIYDNNVLIDFKGQVAFFVENQCRGVALSQSIEGKEGSYFFATIYSNNPIGEQISIKLYDESQNQEINSQRKLTFSSDQIIGNIKQPIDLMQYQQPLLDNIKLTIYPNPTSNNLNIEFDKTYNNISTNIITNTGSTVKTINTTNSNSIKTNIGNLPQGIYILEITADDQSVIKKLLKK